MRLLLLAFVLIGFAGKAQFVNYINYQSPVKSQHKRGTCSAFSLLSAMEVLPGFPTDLSEQHAYALAKTENYDLDSSDAKAEGAGFKEYIDIMDKFGITNEANMPYNPYKGFWQPGQNAFSALSANISGAEKGELKDVFAFTYGIKASDCIYKSGAEAQDVEYIKAQLNAGIKNIPVGYSIENLHWSSHEGNQNKKLSLNDIMLFKIDNKWLNYTNAIAKNKNLKNDVFENKVPVNMKTGYENVFTNGHAVSIIGYDKTGFIFKNSWGQNWGNNGYGWMSFEYHSFLARFLLIIKKGNIIKNDYAIKNKINRDNFWLKTVPNVQKEEGVQLSIVYKGNFKLPEIKAINYKILRACSNAELEQLNPFKKSLNSEVGSWQNGFMVPALTKEMLLDFFNGYTIVLTVECLDGTKFENLYFHVVPRNKEYQPNTY